MKVLVVTDSSRGIDVEICCLAEVAEIANGAMFLLSDKSSYATGAILDVCGGWVSP